MPLFVITQHRVFPAPPLGWQILAPPPGELPKAEGVHSAAQRRESGWLRHLKYTSFAT